ncbi:MAG: hypothetical protein JNN12_06180 [Bacteroidetes Order II. Incertae sedis bacterium]|nr:hypothetical protein [Bacteroidetes Order II. bacterium]
MAHKNAIGFAYHLSAGAQKRHRVLRTPMGLARKNATGFCERQWVWPAKRRRVLRTPMGCLPPFGVAQGDSRMRPITV